MPAHRRNALPPAQRRPFTEPPTDPTSLVHHYTLAPEDLAVVNRHRRPWSRLGFAIQLCSLRFPGHRLRPEEEVPSALLAFSQALATVIDAQPRQPRAASFGPGATSLEA